MGSETYLNKYRCLILDVLTIKLVTQCFVMKLHVTHPADMKNHPAADADTTDNDDNDDCTRDNESSKANYNLLSRLDFRLI